MATTNEWELLRQPFDATTHDEGFESIEDVFDAQFRRRFADLTNQIANLTAQSVRARVRVPGTLKPCNKQKRLTSTGVGLLRRKGG